MRVGYYLPFSIASGMLATLGSGLISTFKPNTNVGTWIGFQIIAGFGRGLGMQMVNPSFPFHLTRTISNALLPAHRRRPKQPPAEPERRQLVNPHLRTKLRRRSLACICANGVRQQSQESPSNIRPRNLLPGSSCGGREWDSI